MHWSLSCRDPRPLAVHNILHVYHTLKAQNTVAKEKEAETQTQELIKEKKKSPLALKLAYKGIKSIPPQL